jgi:hypothetical protein
MDARGKVRAGFRRSNRFTFASKRGMVCIPLILADGAALSGRRITF